jgi:hypothetical protein
MSPHGRSQKPPRSCITAKAAHPINALSARFAPDHDRGPLEKRELSGRNATDEESGAMNSRQLAGVIGPTLVALGITEALNVHIFDNQIAQVVYLNGTILFVAGLALVRAHNRWAWTWPTLITVTGWMLLMGGLYRMIAPEGPQATRESHAVFAAVVVIGVVLSFKGYGPEVRSDARPG